jgi:hypothetical protein
VAKLDTYLKRETVDDFSGCGLKVYTLTHTNTPSLLYMSIINVSGQYRPSVSSVRPLYVCLPPPPSPPPPPPGPAKPSYLAKQEQVLIIWLAEHHTPCPALSLPHSLPPSHPPPSLTNQFPLWKKQRKIIMVKIQYGTSCQSSQAWYTYRGREEERGRGGICAYLDA